MMRTWRTFNCCSWQPSLVVQDNFQANNVQPFTVTITILQLYCLQNHGHPSRCLIDTIQLSIGASCALTVSSQVLKSTFSERHCCWGPYLIGRRGKGSNGRTWSSARVPSFDSRVGYWRCQGWLHQRLGCARWSVPFHDPSRASSLVTCAALSSSYPTTQLVFETLMSL